MIKETPRLSNTEENDEGGRILQSPAEETPGDLSLDMEENRVLALKLRHVNDAIDEIGFTKYQLKLFFLNGFGYAVDSLLILLNALTQSQVALQYQPAVSKAQTIAMGVGLLTGALFWGLGADVSLVFCSDTQRIVDGSMTSSILDYWSTLCFQHHSTLVFDLCNSRRCIPQFHCRLYIHRSNGIW